MVAQANDDSDPNPINKADTPQKVNLTVTRGVEGTVAEFELQNYVEATALNFETFKGSSVNEAFTVIDGEPPHSL